MSLWKKVELFVKRTFYLSLTTILSLFLTLASGLSEEGFMLASSSPLTSTILIANLYSWTVCFFLLRERRFQYPSALPPGPAKEENAQDTSSAGILGEAAEKGPAPVSEELQSKEAQDSDVKPAELKQDSFKVSGTGSRESHNMKREGGDDL